MEFTEKHKRWAMYYLGAGLLTQWYAGYKVKAGNTNAALAAVNAQGYISGTLMWPLNVISVVTA